MNEVSVLSALNELERWKRKKAEMHEDLKRVNMQVSYYEDLVEDMKKEVSPTTLAKLLNQLKLFV